MTSLAKSTLPLDKTPAASFFTIPGVANFPMTIFPVFPAALRIRSLVPILIWVVLLRFPPKPTTEPFAVIPFSNVNNVEALDHVGAFVPLEINTCPVVPCAE